MLVLYTIIAAWIGYYLVSHQSRPFLAFDPSKNPTVKHVARYGGSLMLAVALASIVVVFFQSTVWIAIVLASGSLIMMAIGLLLVSFMQFQ